jgi:hypothetical protein
MSGLIDNIMSHLGDAQIQQIAKQLGTDPAQARAAIEHAVPLIVGGMAQNASNPQGADALNNALGQHVGLDMGSVLGSVLGGGGSGIGSSILGHIFGANHVAANQGLGQATGLGQQNAGQLMAILAPIVMAALANHAQAQGGLNPGALGNILGQAGQQIQQQGGLTGGLLNAVLGHNGGSNFDLSQVLGSVMSGSAGSAGGLGGLLGALTGRA